MAFTRLACAPRRPGAAAVARHVRNDTGGIRRLDWRPFLRAGASGVWRQVPGLYASHAGRRYRRQPELAGYSSRAVAGTDRHRGAWSWRTTGALARRRRPIAAAAGVSRRHA